MDILEEMDKFLEKYNFSKLNQEEIENLNRSITSKEIETAIRNFPENYRGKLQNSFYEATITLIPKPEKDAMTKKTTGQYH